MNRQMRRIQEKSDKKQDKEREEKRAARRAKVMAKRESRRGSTKPASSGSGASTQARASTSSTRPRNRFLGILAVVNVVVVLYGGLITPADASLTDRIMYGLLYVTLAYFICRWLIGRSIVSRALSISVFTGITLAIGIELAKVFVSGATPDPFMPLLVLPALLIGAFGGVYIDRKLHGSA